jgi:hypothetical protein
MGGRMTLNVVDFPAWLFNFAKDNKVSFFLKPIDTLPLPSITVTEIFKHFLYLRRAFLGNNGSRDPRRSHFT